MKIIRQRLTKLANIFDSKTIFRIPSYQRGYAWTEEQWQDLWDDLCFTPSDKTHYTGLLTLTQESSDTLTHHEQAWLAKDPEYTCYYVVDGQQRLTTILLLVSLLVKDDSALRRRYLEVEAGLAVFDYALHTTTQALHEVWHHTILGNQVISVTESNLYTRNIEDAKTFFIQKIADMEISEAMLLDKLLHSLTFNLFLVDKSQDVHTLFESINNRGKPLSHLELLKSRLIYLSTKMAETNENLEEQIHVAWQQIYFYLDQLDRCKDDYDEAYLKDHFHVYFGNQQDHRENFVVKFLKKYTDKNGNAKEPDWHEILLKDIFPLNLLHHDHVNAPFIAQYCQSLSGWISYWVLLKKPVLIKNNHFKHIQLEERSWRYIEALTRLTRDADLLALLAVSIEEMATEGNAPSTKQELYAFLVQLERWIFVQKSFDSKKITYDWAMRYAYRLHRYSQYPSSYREGWKECAFIAMAERKQAETEQYLHQNPEMFKNTIDGLFKNKRGFYGWRMIRYFLYEYECHLAQKSGKVSPLLWQEVEEASSDTEEEKVNNDSKKKSIEHILPQTIEKTDWEIQLAIYSGEQIQNITHSLGNLALIQDNSKASNKSYSGKVKIYQDDTLSVQEVARLYPDDWSLETIKARGESLLAFMEERWKIMGLAEQADNLLHLPKSK